MAAHEPVTWRLCVLLSEPLCPGGDWRTIAEKSIEAGVDCIQLREKSLTDHELLHRAQELRVMTRGRCDLIINDRPDIAMLIGAEGVHLGQDDLPCQRVRTLLGDDFIIGVSTSTLDQAKQAQREGADYCGVGPMFPTGTKHKEKIVGPDYLREYITWGRLPHLAIGGIAPSNIHELIDVGCRGVAVSSAVCRSPEPDAAVRSLLSALDG